MRDPGSVVRGPGSRVRDASGASREGTAACDGREPRSDTTPDCAGGGAARAASDNGESIGASGGDGNTGGAGRGSGGGGRNLFGRGLRGGKGATPPQKRVHGKNASAPSPPNTATVR